MNSRFRSWFDEKGWSPFPFQEEVWTAYANGESGLIHSATGSGKTLAAWLGPLQGSVLQDQQGSADQSQPGTNQKTKLTGGEALPLTVLWLTPLRALAGDTVEALRGPVAELGLPWTVEARTGDTSSSVRAKQKQLLPSALVTTPESLSLSLAQPDCAARYASLRCVVVDEWHELLSSKRGVLAELSLARLRKICPKLQVWGISATLGNLSEAMNALMGTSEDGRFRPGRLVQGEVGKQIVIDTLLPERVDRFPWAGHFGTSMIPQVVEAIDGSGTCLVFCNTRAQCEIWFSNILSARPDWKDSIALHHGSLDRQERDKVEVGLKNGTLRAVICTSSLDLGVDFTPVERVIQVGSPKGVARLLQRAGRSGHRPGIASRITCVPTHAFELVDIAAARDLALAGAVEGRETQSAPLDVLAQHAVTLAVGAGYSPDELYQEVRTTHAYRNLSPSDWEWVIDFITRGGSTLQAYPEFRRVQLVDGICRVTDKDVAQRHRLSVGTIVSDAAVLLQTVRGSKFGTVEESFVARLRKGDRFLFSGRVLEFVRLKDMSAIVQVAKSRAGAVPRWAGGRLPLSTELANGIREKLDMAQAGELASPEMQAISPVLEVQARWSKIPRSDELLIEDVEDSEGYHLFFFPIEGRMVHEGLAALFAFRIARRVPITFSIAYNDYGFELLSATKAPLLAAIEDGLFSTDGLAADLQSSLNSAELAKRQFREIARVSGLVYEGMPGKTKSLKQVQASSGLFFDVFQQYDPENRLLKQAEQEVMAGQLDKGRIIETLERLSSNKLVVTHPPRPTPMAFPILVDRTRDTVSSERLADRIEKLVADLNAAVEAE